MRKQTLPTPEELPFTMPIAACGKLFFGASKSRSYRLAAENVIPVMKTSKHGRGMVALPRVLAKRLMGEDR
jgi:hypothetical protein